MGVAAKQKLQLQKGGMQNSQALSLYEISRYVRAACPIRHGNRTVYCHIGSFHNEPAADNAAVVNKERYFEKIFADAQALGEQPVFLCCDTNWSKHSPTIEQAIASGLWTDLGVRFQPTDGPEPTFGQKKGWDKISKGPGITRPDRIYANSLAALMVTSFELLRWVDIPGHIPIKITLSAAP